MHRRSLAICLTTSLLLVAAGACGGGSDVPDAGPHDAGHVHEKDSGHHDSDPLPPLVCAPPPVDAGTDAPSESGDGAKLTDGSHDAVAESAVTDASKDADAGDAATSCIDGCTLQFPDAYTKFSRYALSECGCTAAGACYAECHESRSSEATSACGMCLAAQGTEGLASTCMLAAAADCSTDMDCASFQTCAGMCPM